MGVAEKRFCSRPDPARVGSVLPAAQLTVLSPLRLGVCPFPDVTESTEGEHEALSPLLSDAISLQKVEIIVAVEGVV